MSHRGVATEVPKVPRFRRVMRLALDQMGFSVDHQKICEGIPLRKFLATPLMSHISDVKEHASQKILPYFSGFLCILSTLDCRIYRHFRIFYFKNILYQSSTKPLILGQNDMHNII